MSAGTIISGCLKGTTFAVISWWEWYMSFTSGPAFDFPRGFAVTDCCLLSLLYVSSTDFSFWGDWMMSRIPPKSSFMLGVLLTALELVDGSTASPCSCFLAADLVTLLFYWREISSCSLMRSLQFFFSSLSEGSSSSSSSSLGLGCLSLGGRSPRCCCSLSLHLQQKRKRPNNAITKRVIAWTVKQRAISAATYSPL